MVETSDAGASELARVAFFGGSFDPPHVAHVLSAAYVLSVGAVDRVVVAPVYRHPFGKVSADFEHRLRMCELAFAWIPAVVVSTVERDLGGESRTLRTLEHLTVDHPTWRMRLLVGSDVLAETHAWHRWDRITELAPPLVVERPGSLSRPDALALPDVSSTAVRAALARGDLQALRDRVPARVLDYVERERLYVGSR